MYKSNKGLKMQPSRPPPKFNARPSPKKGTFVYRKHKKPNKKIITSPTMRTTNNHKPPESILVPRPLVLKKSPYGDRQITIKDTIKRLRRGDGHVPRLAYYNDNKLKVLKFKDNVGLTLPNDNYSLEHENSKLSAEFTKDSRRFLSMKSKKTFESSIAIGHPHAIKKQLENQLRRDSIVSNGESTKKLKIAEDIVADNKFVKKSAFCYKEWKDYSDLEKEINTEKDTALMLDEMDQIDNLCERKSNDWLPANGIEFLNEERFVKNLLRSLDEDSPVAKIFSEYKPAAKPGSEADKLRNKSLARMGLLIDIKQMKLKSIARKFKLKAQEAVRKKKSDAIQKAEATAAATTTSTEAEGNITTTTTTNNNNNNDNDEIGKTEEMMEVV